MFTWIKKGLLMVLAAGVLSGCMNESKTAMIDVQAILSSGPHAQVAAEQIKQAQAIYQNNLNTIEAKLKEYQNKEQARAYLVEAARQLQTQLNNSQLLVTQSLLNALNTVLDGQKQVYDLIVKKDGIIYVKEESSDSNDKLKALPEDITTKVQVLYDQTDVTYPPLPKLVEEPNLPADLGEGVPFPPKPANVENSENGVVKE